MTSEPTRTLTARGPEDLLALVPVVLGFHPAHSIVMLTFGGAGTGFHARVDLPPADEVPQAVAPLLEAAVRHRVRRVAFVVYTEDAALGSRAARRLGEAFGEAGCEVVAMLRADGRRWHLLRGRASDRYDVGAPYDVATHPFAVQAVFDGTVTHASRAALEASLAPLPQRVEALAAAVDAAAAAGPAREDPDAAGQSAADSMWAAERVRAALASGGGLDDAEAARLLVALVRLPVRDAVWQLINRDTAQRHVGFWTELVRAAPAPYAAAPAVLLAISAYRAGHGALAWCALDRCLAADPAYTLAHYVSTALERAIPPSAWDEIWGADGVDPLVS